MHDILVDAEEDSESKNIMRNLYLMRASKDQQLEYCGEVDIRLHLKKIKGHLMKNSNEVMLLSRKINDQNQPTYITKPQQASIVSSIQLLSGKTMLTTRG